VTVEAASPFGWERYAGDRGRIIAMAGFGASGPSDDVRAHFGFTVDSVVDAVRDMLAVADAPVML
jgi:transketolase